MRNDGQSVALRSRNEKLTSKKTNIYVVDTLGWVLSFTLMFLVATPLCTFSIDMIWFCLFSSGELREFYGVAPIAVIGGSFFPELTGHNVSEAAAAGCAVITGAQ